jgi:wyosine [tRNA(Phe)-imidazoG37] synthetase (radical SAM superfamily)
MADATPPPSGRPRRIRADGGFLWESVVIGPVHSRRLGTSLGLNLLPARSKLCGFNCPYCECGFNTARAPGSRWPSPDEVAHGLRQALQRRGAPDWITFSGNGEPTLHPRFAGVVDRVLAARDEMAPGTPVAILSNGLTASTPGVREALLRLDARIMKLDPGPPLQVNGVAWNVDRLVSAYRALKPLTIQAMVARGGEWDGSSDASLAAWVPLVLGADPDAIQLYTVDRPPADATIHRVTRERLLAMAQAIREALPRCDVRVY